MKDPSGLNSGIDNNLACLAKAAADISLVTVLDDDENMLLIRRSPESTDSGRWESPLGHVDPGETDEVAAHRELKEETGLTAELLKDTTIIETKDGKKTLRLFVGRAKGVKPEVKLRPDEHDEYKWLKPSELSSIRKTHKHTVTDTQNLFDHNGLNIKVASTQGCNMNTISTLAKQTASNDNNASDLVNMDSWGGAAADMLTPGSWGGERADEKAEVKNLAKAAAATYRLQRIKQVLVTR